MLKAILSHPLTRDLDIDDPRTTQLRRRIIREKSFLRRIYLEWYEMLVAALPVGGGEVLEIGSGAGFLSDFIPNLITADILCCPGIKVVLEASNLPFRDDALRAIVMTNVLHHLPHPRRFLLEAARCVQAGGAIIMVEPWVTPWSRLIYTKLHHESFHPEALNWEFPRTGPLSGANGAMPWIIFERDRQQFEMEFPAWQIQDIKPIMPFRYLISGGVSLRTLMPGWTFGIWRKIENALQPWMANLAMFAQIILVRVNP